MLLRPPRAAAIARAVSIDIVAHVRVAEEPTVGEAVDSRLSSGCARRTHESRTIAEATPTFHRSFVLAFAAGRGHSLAAVITAL